MRIERGQARRRVVQVARLTALMVFVSIFGIQMETVWPGINRWTNLGPEGGIIHALAVDPQNQSTVYVGTGRAPAPPALPIRWGGVFKSTNGGESWSAASSGLTATDVYGLALDPQTPSTVYAGTNSGVFKSTNGGASWSTASSGLAASYVLALAVDPQTPSTVYAGTKDVGVFKSTNSGTTWSAANDGLTTNLVFALAIDPQNPRTVYAGTDGGVFVITSASPILTLDSTNHCIGASWNLKVSNAVSSATVRLLGTTNSESWEIAQWQRTDTNGSFSVEGTFANGTEGSYTLSVEIGGALSNAISFVVSNCRH